MMNLIQQSPPSPSNKYGLAIYSDEVVPGNTVAPDNLRKIWVIYASVIQFGPVALSQEASWLTIGCCRSSCLSLVKGGIGQLIKEILKKTFQVTNFDVTQAGFVLKSKGGNITEYGWIYNALRKMEQPTGQPFQSKVTLVRAAAFFVKMLSVEGVAWWMKMELQS